MDGTENNRRKKEKGNNKKHMKKLVSEYKFGDEQLKNIRNLARELSLTETVVKLLCARGVDTAEKIRKFLSPSKEHFLSPYLMSGMKEAVELIRRAKEEDWNVAVYGDYDADGICASSVMYYALRAFGIEPRLYIPERSDGYGLSVAAADKIFDDFIPDLFITVDCGISNYKEVEYIKEQGAYVIVTDHHELPPILPDCICVNPKFSDDYPYDNLCGAGVAFKLACALIGEEAYSLLDFTALATVADSVPLLGENRDIVYEGLKLISENPRRAFSVLLGKASGENITAQTLAFTVAPRINAAGRMGDAASALKLFLSESPTEIYDLALKLNEYNMQRQERCDLLYESAKEKIRKKGAYGNVIMLYDENWSSGFVGIVAARIAEEYCRPTLLFVKNGNAFKGSARSIESVNIFDALKNCSEYIEEFGGHAQAAGINVTEENFEKLEKKLDEYIEKTYTAEDFIPKLCVSEEIVSDFSLKLAHELNALEPYGVGHKKPLFYLTARSLSVRPVKNKSPHLMIKTNYIDLMYFSGAKYAKLIESDVKKQFVFECNCSVFRGRESVKGFVRDVLYDGNSSEIAAWRFSATLERLRGETSVNEEEIKYLSRSEVEDFIRKKRAESAYGLCMIASDLQTVHSFSVLADMSPDLIYLSARNVANAVVVSPAVDADLSDYRDVVFLDRPPDFNLTGIAGKPCYVNREAFGFRQILKLDATRDGLLSVFAAVRAHAGELKGCNVEETAVFSHGLGFSMEECMFALAIFEELGLIDYENGRLTVYRGIRADLNDSVLYKKVISLQQSV